MGSAAYADRVGTRRINFQGVAMEIIAYRTSLDADVRFDDWCGTVVQHVKYDLFCKGVVRDPNHKLYCGVGYIGQGAYRPCDHKKAYYIWIDMLRRCYSASDDNYPAYGARGVYVADEWLCFQNFVDWYVHNCAYPDMHVDKDLKGGAYYGPDVCIMIPRKLNHAIKGLRGDEQRGLPSGVVMKGKRFASRLSCDGKNVCIGTYDTADDAYAAYLTAKAAYVGLVASDLDQFLSADAKAAVMSYCARLCDEASTLIDSICCSAHVDRIGERHMNYQGVMMEIIAYRTRDDIDIRFDDWCNTVVTHVSYPCFCNGGIRDPNYKLYFGVGYLGQGIYNKANAGNMYDIWRLMLARCYNARHKDYPYYGARGVYVGDEWHCFQTFAQWYADKCRYPDMVIDKDLNGGTHYGPDVCVMVPRRLNIAAKNSYKKRPLGLPTGVYPRGKRFEARIWCGGKCILLGSYEQSDKARISYIMAKIAHVESVASELDQFLSDGARAAVANYCSRLRKEADGILSGIVGADAGQ